MPYAFRERINAAILEGHPLAYELFAGWLEVGVDWDVAEWLTAWQLWGHSHRMEHDPAN